MDNSETRLIMPELILFNTINSILKFIHDDFQKHADEEKTWLYRIFHGQRVDNFDFFIQAKKVFLQEADSPRLLQCRMFFDSSRAHLPTIHINLPQENEGENGIGIDQGHAEPIYDEINNTYTNTFTRRYDASYNLIITSENTFEVIMIYHFLKAMLVATMDHIQLSGLENPKTGGQDLQIYSEIIPTNVFMRGVTLSFSYDMNVPSIFNSNMVQNFIFEQQIQSPYSNE